EACQQRVPRRAPGGDEERGRNRERNEAELGAGHCDERIDFLPEVGERIPQRAPELLGAGGVREAIPRGPPAVHPRGRRAAAAGRGPRPPAWWPRRAPWRRRRSSTP